MNILITGGTGYIGSHLAVVLQQFGINIVLYDNLSNSKKDVLEHINQITNLKPIFVCGDLLDTNLLSKTLKKHHISTVIHLGASKSIVESAQNPINYYENNVVGSLHLFKAMQDCKVRRLMFASSSAVYGNVKNFPIFEEHPKKPINPYGRSKLYTEQMLSDIVNTFPNWQVVVLRYFNVVGAHDSGLLNESPPEASSNIFSVLRQVSFGQKSVFPIYGNSYPTPDGTAIRDYVHVMDVARAHLLALQCLLSTETSWEDFNLGSGLGFSILDIVKVFEKCSGHNINYEFLTPRMGDVATSFASIEKIKNSLNWYPEKNLHDMCESFLKAQCPSDKL